MLNEKLSDGPLLLITQIILSQVVYNYLKKEVSAEVTLENTEDSGFVFGSKDPNSIDSSGPPVDLFRTKRVEVGLQNLLVSALKRCWRS